jgi:hypothetical protein
MKERKKHEKAHCKSERNKQVKRNIRKDRLVGQHSKSFKVLNTEGSNHGGGRNYGSDSSYKKGVIYLK